ncbi:MAG TPA: aminotransferase class III-fold pyridoxal phosphate-dependent enzyme [Myxococcota bacterium]|nr:aminotransferase class III-fold pyridoxal phosphate-dependent enzyme [Myxococcota bacterium]HQK52155.1 aminotransferase class III-fold pyridoxal phosphate-dependent enzyme [Myxococcota bacterium]
MSTNGSDALLEVFSQVPLRFCRGQGSRLWTEDGREFVDFYGGHAVALLGHGHPAVVQAIGDQASRLIFQSNLFPLEVREEAARDLRAFAGLSSHRVFFVNSGAEANENALRIALRATGRSTVVRMEGSFHGRTAAAAAVTEGAREKWYGFPNTPFPVRRVALEDLGGLERAIDQDTAAVILEPVQGVAGARDLSATFLRAARDLTRRHGALLIADEVQCGMGRCGVPFVSVDLGLDPDLLTVGKGLAGGLPGAAVLVSEALARGLRPGDLGTTFGGGPVVCAAIRAVIRAIEQDHLLERVQRLSARIDAECRRGPVLGVQGQGFLKGLRTRRPASEVLAGLRERGILAGGSGDPQVVRLLPPLVLDDADVDRLRDALEEMES